MSTEQYGTDMRAVVYVCVCVRVYVCLFLRWYASTGYRVQCANIYADEYAKKCSPNIQGGR